MFDTENQFSETEDSKLKQFLTGSRIYTMLAAAIICAIVAIPVFFAMMGVYSNVRQAENVKSISEVNLGADLDGQYVTGSAYKFLTKLGYIAESEAAAYDFYYLLYLDSPDGQQIATVVKADKRGDADIQGVIKAYLSYVKDPDAGYKGNIVEIEGRFHKLSSQEEQMLKKAVSALNISSPCLGYTLKIGKLPTKKDTIGYWFVLMPFSIAVIVCSILFMYGLKLENERAKANESPYPYQNRKKKKK